MVWRCLETELDVLGKLLSEKMGVCMNGVASLSSGLSPFHGSAVDRSGSSAVGIRNAPLLLYRVIDDAPEESTTTTTEAAAVVEEGYSASSRLNMRPRKSTMTTETAMEEEEDTPRLIVWQCA